MTDSVQGQLSGNGRTIITGATVVNTVDGSLVANVDIEMAGGRITSISPSAPDHPEPVIDGRGKFVVPGYLDMHVHALNVEDPAGTLALMLALGITGYRLMGGSPELLAQRESGTLTDFPDGPSLLSMPGAVLTPMNAGTEAAAVETVREQHAAGADFIKVGFVTPAVFFAAQAEAQRLGIPIVGHLPAGIDVVAASKGGMKSIEHLGPGVGVLAACSTDESSVLGALADRPPRPTSLPFSLPFTDMATAIMNPLLMYGPADRVALRRAVETFSEAHTEALAAKFVADGTWHAPTLIRERTCEFSDAPEYRNDPNLRFVHPSIIEKWRNTSALFEELPDDVRATYRDAYAIQLRLTGIFDRAGVKILAGSDSTGAGWEVPGFALHQEFDELAKAGLSPLRVLQATTLSGAEFLGMTDTLGTVEEGNRADLVLLDHNPVESVEHLHGISGVLKGGRYYSAAALQALKDRVAAERSIA